MVAYPEFWPSFLHYLIRRRIDGGAGCGGTGCQVTDLSVTLWLKYSIQSLPIYRYDELRSCSKKTVLPVVLSINYRLYRYNLVPGRRRYCSNGRSSGTWE